MAGAIAELKKGPLSSDQKNAANRIHVHLIEAGPRLLPSFSPYLSLRTKKDLENLGVEVHTEAIVNEVKTDRIIIKDKSTIESHVTIWAAGVKGESAMAKLRLPIEANRIKVGSTLQVENYPYIFAIGDIAGAKDSSGR